MARPTSTATRSTSTRTAPAQASAIPAGTNDLEIDSSRRLTGDVSMEAADGIYVTETDGTLHLVLAEAFAGDIRITVRETDPDASPVGGVARRGPRPVARRQRLVRRERGAHHPARPRCRARRLRPAADRRRRHHDIEQRDPRRRDDRHLRRLDERRCPLRHDDGVAGHDHVELRRLGHGLQSVRRHGRQDLPDADLGRHRRRHLPVRRPDRRRRRDDSRLRGLPPARRQDARVRQRGPLSGGSRRGGPLQRLLPADDERRRRPLADTRRPG